MLSNDPTAPAELSEVTLRPLVTRLRKTYPRLPDPALIDSAVVDALISYIKNPGQYDPGKKDLLSYLVMSSKGDLKNLLAKQKRRKKREILIENVDNCGSNRELINDRGIVGEIELKEMKGEITDIFDNTLDRSLVELILSGERNVAEFSRLLGIDNLPIEEQRRIVKRHKDRIKKRLERHG